MIHSMAQAYQFFNIQRLSNIGTIKLRKTKLSFKTLLPKDFTEILPVNKSKPEDPRKPSSLVNDASAINLVLKNGDTWLENLTNSASIDRVFFSAYFSKALNLSQPVKDTSVFLPLFTESINSSTMVFHCLKCLNVITKYIWTQHRILLSLLINLCTQSQNRYSDNIQTCLQMQS